MSTHVRKFELVHIFDDIEKLTEKLRLNTSVPHFNVSWRIGIGLNDDKDKVEFYLYCDKPRNKGTWSIETKFDLKIISANGTVRSHSTGYTFCSPTDIVNSYGWPFYMLFDDLKRVYAIDGKVIAESHVTIKEMTGIEAPEKLKLKNFNEAKENNSIIVIKVGDEKFYVPKNFLMSQSAFFESLLSEESNESKQSEVILEDVNPQTFQAFLEMLYCEPSLTDYNIEDLLKLTKTYKSKSGAHFCELFLMHESKHTLRTKLRIACKYKFEKSKKHILDNMKSAIDVRSAVGVKVSKVDPFISVELIKKLISFYV